MSLQIQAAMYQGDPGLFSFVGKALKSVGKIAGKVVGGAAGALAGLAKGGPLGAVSGALTGSGIIKIPKLPTAQNPVLMGMASPGVVGPGGGVRVGGGLQIGGGGVSLGGGLQIGNPGAPGTMIDTNGQVCRGHMNRTSYYSQRAGGVVPAGTVCVKNRTMNPLNPRALSRSMRRLTSAAKAMNKTQKLIQRLAVKAGGRRGHSGCRGKKR